ncbi:MAG: prepilin peptidase, partial [Planctomycetota bacterium]
MREGLSFMKIRGKAVSPGKLAFWAALLVAGIYMIVLPSIELVLDTFRVRPMSEKLEKMTPAQYFQLRTAKLAVFSIFAYAGACIGSFLNVAAASAPRGEPIALRDSACPQCGTPLRRIDNLPIYSYLKLRGRCRTCQAEIPIRYLFVELIGLVVFAALFLYELTTGA